MPKFPEEVEHWNTFDTLPRVQAFAASRARSLRARQEDPFWNANWKQGIEKLATSSFATGKNDRGWRADIDWLLKPDSLARVIEGKYDDSPPSPHGSTHTKYLALTHNRRTRNNSCGDSCDIEALAGPIDPNTVGGREGTTIIVES